MPNLPMSVLTVPTEIEGEMVAIPYEIKDANARAGVSASVDLLKDTAGWTGKNKLKNLLSSVTVSGVAFTYNAVDGTVSTSGTATERIQYMMQHESKYDPNIAELIGKEIVLSGCPQNGSANTYCMDMWWTSSTEPHRDNGEGFKFTFPDILNESAFNIKIDIKAGTNVDGKVFKPMICTAEQYALSPSYEPYHDTVEAELAKKADTADVAAIAEVIPSSATPSNKVATAGDVTAAVDLLNDTTGWIGKSKVPNTASSTSRGNVAFTVNENKTVQVVANNNSAYQALTINSNIGDYLEVGKKYTLCGTPLKPSGATYRQFELRIRKNSNNDVVASDVGNSVEFTYTQEMAQADTYRLDIAIFDGTTYNGLFAPMITTSEEYKLSPSYEPYHGSVEEVKADKTDVTSKFAASVSLLDDTVGWLGKNRFNGKATSESSQGVTWNVDANDNNIVTVSGTPTGFKAFVFKSYNVLPAGDYILSGISDMVNVVWNSAILFKNDSIVRDLNIQDVNTPKSFSILPTDDYDEIRVTLKRSTNGVACSGTGKLMITTPEQYALNPAYRPYHESVEDALGKLTENVQGITDRFTKKLTSGSILNAVTQNGFIYAEATCDDLPLSNRGFLCITLFGASTFCAILAIPYKTSDNDIYINVKASATWNGWKKITIAPYT